MAAQQQQAQHALRLVAILYLVPLPLPAVGAVGHIQTHNHQQLARVVMEVLAAAVVMGKIPILTSAVELETRQALVRHKAITAVRGLLAPLPFLAWAAVVAALAGQEEVYLTGPVERAAQARHQAFPVHLSHTQVVAAVGEIAERLLVRQAVQPLLVAAEMVVAFRVQMALLQLPIQAVVAEPVVITHRLLVLPQQAALASSSSSTTSALPQSSPSSHRRSGLRQRVR